MKSAQKLRELLSSQNILIVPGCYDAFSARLIENAGFPAAFMGGFAVSVSRLGMPDTGLISYAEMADQGRNICNAVSFPVFGDGDTGYGNAVNVQRTVKGYADAGFACIMIEDQTAPKRCGHTRGKQIVSRDEAFSRIQAAVDTRESGADILIIGRTDANAVQGMDEAVFRAKKFIEIGADITFLEAPKDEKEMHTYCDNVPGPKMANMVEQGKTPILTPSRLQEIGYKIAAYPLTLMLAGMNSMKQTLKAIKQEKQPENLAEFSELKDMAGFPEYYKTENKYRV
ncbi:Phosphoenolpyruvate phosphomutase family protein [Desulfonema limicola]|uniref:Phosphoenolpyruvate phosphomutase family protein n=1 Tax=Desulfonema limicola TaxID=45656 RepID=A0A975BCJ9_9BACT|nr:isocitrate lyase/PEP mutase family protein [Desulfonema limicola]QTA82868.1 Phosphoenolpyruvate phosphomutase family protein [Desulfonema limicola]